jgi:hypothetical protein
MKGKLNKLMGTATMVAALGLTSAVFAGSANAAPEAMTVRGQIERVEIGATRGTQQAQLGIVNPQGQLMVLTPASGDTAAYKAAMRMADRDDWARVRGVVSKKDGVISLSVEQVRKV